MVSTGGNLEEKKLTSQILLLYLKMSKHMAAYCLILFYENKECLNNLKGKRNREKILIGKTLDLVNTE